MTYIKSIVAFEVTIAVLSVSFYASLPQIVEASRGDAVSCWSFDDVSGNATDSSGSNVLTNNNSMSYTQGIIGGSADIDALAGPKYLSISDDDQSGLDIIDNLSMSLWVNFDATNPSAQPLISKFVPNTNDESYALVMNHTDDYLILWADGDGVPLSSVMPGISAVKIWPFDPVVGEWYHIAVSYADGDAKLFVNGSELTNPILNALDTSIYNSNAPFEVGHTPGVWQESDLKLDELAIWNRALKKGEIKKLYNKGEGISCEELAR